MKQNKFQSKGERALYGIYLLSKGEKNPITVEDLAVRLWKLYPLEFCMKGYPEFPNVDIQKYLTKLKVHNLISGGVTNYKITTKGIKRVEETLKTSQEKRKKLSETDVSISRELRGDILRILNSKVYKYYLTEKNPEFIEIDFFEFLGTSPRSFHDKRNSQFVSKINLIRNDLVKYCELNKDKDKNLKNILELWRILNNKFGEILK